MLTIKDNMPTLGLSMASAEVSDTSYHTESRLLHCDTVGINVKPCLSSHIKYSLNSVDKVKPVREEESHQSMYQTDQRSG